ncbi:ABC transporter substrate-binding protein [Microtetraspora glauca]|uniref:ABC transporter substrate-binding protein n=1 Tax=Microtetraspora glauca TaxID=1996 RepID=A0ABV3GRP8_MICGL
MTSRTPRRTRTPSVALLAALPALAVATGGCGLLGTDKKADTGEAGQGKVTITLAGPNQWNTSGSSFGPAWEALVDAFEKREPGIEVRTQVLPLDGFTQTITSQLAAGTAPELVFNQPPHKAHEVHALDEELQKPNPYVPGNQRWIDVFRKEYFGPDVSKALSKESGKLEYIPFNLVAIGLFYNKDAFTKAGIQQAPATWEDFRAACAKLKAAGYDPVALDKGALAAGWTWESITTQLTDKYYDQWNYFDVTGKPGKAPSVTEKSLSKAIKEGTLTAAKTPEVAESLKLYKEFFDNGTPNWSGVADGGATVGYRDFVTGKAAMSWGTDFAVEALKTDAKFAIGTMPFPTITKATTPVSTDAPARYGASVGGTSYMVPSTVKGEKYAATIKFLQFMSSPAIKPWLDATGGLPAIEGVEPSSETAGLLEGEWGKIYRVHGLPGGPEGSPFREVFDGFLLGKRSLQEELPDLQKWWDRGVEAGIKKNNWGDEDWAR